MNVVEAIDSWIDDRIDDLSDAELEEILDLLDLIADSEFADLDAGVIDDDDIDDMVALVDGDDEQINYANWVFSSALIGDEDLGVGYLYDDSDVDARDDDAGFVDRTRKGVEDRADNGDAAHDADFINDIHGHDDRTLVGDTELTDDSEADNGDTRTDGDDTELTDDSEGDTSDTRTDGDDTELTDDSEADNGDTRTDGDDTELTDDSEANNGDTRTDGDDTELTDDSEADNGDTRTDGDDTELTDDSEADNGDTRTDGDDTELTDDSEANNGDTRTDGDDTELTDDSEADNGDTRTDGDDTELTDDSEADNGDTRTDGDEESAFAQFEREIRGVDATTDPATADALSGDPEPEPLVLMPASDGLGPSFLPPIDVPPDPPVRNDAWKRWTVAALIIAALAVFAYGTVQLFDSLDDAPVAATSIAAARTSDDDAPAPATAAVPDTTTAPTRSPSTETAAQAPTADAPRRPPAQAAIVLADGTIILATVPDDGTEAATDFDTIYEPEAEENRGAAIRGSWTDDALGIVDGTGNVHIFDATTRDVSTIYIADDDLAPATAMAQLGSQVAVLTDDGSIWVMERTDTASPSTLTQLWDAEEEEARATSIIAAADRLAFTLESGDAKLMTVGSARKTVTDLWSSTDDTPAPRIESGPNDTLLWIWDGAISRFSLDANDETKVEVVWDPSTVVEKPVIGFTPAGERFAVILQDGAVVLATENGDAQKLWDPTETELRVQAITASADEVIMLLETGSVLGIALDVDPPRINPIWDITDETLSPARQVAIRP